MDRLIFKVYVVLYSVIVMIIIGIITSIWIASGWKAGLASIGGLLIGIVILYLAKRLWQIIDLLLDKLYDKYVA